MMLAWQFGPKGRFDTVYITASSEQQSLVAPIIAGFLSQIREATFTRARKDEADDYFTRPPVLWALDEVAGIAPMRDLPETLSQSGGQGLLVAICLQDLSLARARWDKAADAFLTLFGNVVVHPGIRDKATLEAISTVVGKEWKTVTSEGMTENHGRDRQGRNSNDGYTYTSNQQQVDVLDPGAVAQGRVTEHPHYVLALTPEGCRLAVLHALLLVPSLAAAARRHDGVRRLVRRCTGGLLGSAAADPQQGRQRAVARQRLTGPARRALPPGRRRPQADGPCTPGDPRPARRWLAAGRLRRLLVVSAARSAAVLHRHWPHHDRRRGL